MSKIISPGYTVSSLEFKNKTVKDVLENLTDLASNFESGCDEERNFYFRPIETTVNERFWLGKNVKMFGGTCDSSKIVNCYKVLCGKLSTGNEYFMDVKDVPAGDFERWKILRLPETVPVFGDNIALGCGLTSTLLDGQTGLTYLTDGLCSSCWYGGPHYQQEGHYVQVDLGAVYSYIGSVNLNASMIANKTTDFIEGFKIEVAAGMSGTDLVDATTVFQVADDEQLGTNNPTITFAPQEGRYVRVTVTNAKPYYWRMGEFEVREWDADDITRWAEYSLDQIRLTKEKAKLEISDGFKAIEPKGKAEVFGTDGASLGQYPIKAVKYSFKPGKKPKTIITLGDIEKGIAEELLDLIRKSREQRLSGSRSNSQLYTGPGGINSQKVSKQVIDIPHMVNAVKISIAEGTSAYNGTIVYRSEGVPTNTPDPSGIDKEINANGTMNIKLSWNAYTQGTKKADFIMLFWKKGVAALGAPGVNDSCITFNVNTAAGSYYIFEGVNPADNWSFGIAAVRRTENGIEVGAIQSPISEPDWQDVTEGTADYTANIDGTAATTVKGNAANGKTSYDGTVNYRSTGAPTNNPNPTAIDIDSTPKAGNIDIKLSWNTYSQGARKADMLMLFWKKGNSSGLGAPGVNDSCISFNVNTASASFYIFEGLAAEKYYSFGVAAVRRTENALEIGTIVSPTSSPDWQDVTSGTPDFKGNLDGETAANVHTWADDPAARVNAKATLIEPAKLSLTWEAGKIVIGQDALGANKPGMIVNDGTFDRIVLGKINADYSVILKDVAGNITVDLGKIMGASNFQYENAELLIQTNSTEYIDMAGMTITHTFPKCICYMFAVIWGHTTAANDLRYMFYVDTGRVGYISGQESGCWAVTNNMHVQELSAGEHTVKLQWKTTQGEVNQDIHQRQLGLIFWEIQ